MSGNRVSLIYPEVAEEGLEHEVTVCGALTTIALSFEGSWMLRPAGEFSALTILQIQLSRMDSSELSDLVSRQCPLLKKLDLVVALVAVFGVSMHSDTMDSM